MLEMIIKYWLELLLTSITSITIYMFNQYNSIKKGLKSLLKNEIIRIYENYSKLGYCPSYMKENINDIYFNYHRLNGNGVITTMVNELYKLPNSLESDGNEK